MSLWKACDIRGVFPSEVNPAVFEDIGRYIPLLLPGKARVTVAGDFRVSTLLLKSALIRGLVQAGVSVLDAGQLPTPIAYFAHDHWGTDAVLVVTASHNPAEYNGLKLMVGYLPPTEEDLQALRNAVERKQFRETQTKGSVIARDPTQLYKAWIDERWQHLKSGKQLQLVLDAGNGAWSQIAPTVFEALGFVVHRVFCEIDGRFINRAPDSARAVNLLRLQDEVRRANAHAGIAWDGDGDRVSFLDNDGKFVSADEISMFIVRKLLLGRPGEKVAYDIKLSDAFRRTVLSLKGIPLVERSGHTFLKRRVIESRCLLGCEISGHYFFRELHGGDDGLFAALHIVELLQNGHSFAQLRRELPPFYVTPDLRLPAQQTSYETVVSRLREALGFGSETAVDGVRIETAEGFTLVRRSVTEPVVTIRMEGFSREALQSLVAQVTSSLREFRHHIQTQISQEAQNDD